MITPPSPDDLASRLKKAGKLAEDKIQEARESAAVEIERSKNEDHFYDAVITNDSLEAAYESLEKFIYGADSAAQTNGATDATGVSASAGEDVAMKETPPGLAEGPPPNGEEANVPTAAASAA